MSVSYMIRTNALNQWDTLIAKLGGQAEPLLQQFGLTHQSLSSELETMPINQLVILLNTCAAKFDCSDFGLRLGQLQDFTMLGPLGIMLTNSRTPREALGALRGYMAFHNQSEYWDYLEVGELAIIRRYENFHDIRESRQYKELALSACYQLCRLLLGNKLNILRVEFSHAPVSDLRSYQRCFMSDVSFNCEHDQLTLPRQVLDQPLHTGNSAIKHATKHYLQMLKARYQRDIVQQVTVLVQQTLHTQQATIEHIAQLLNIHKRTLQRQLKLQGVEFKTLVRKTRMQRARWYLQSSQMDLTLISHLLGYGDISNFSRAFKQENGCPPLKWRQQVTASVELEE